MEVYCNDELFDRTPFQYGDKGLELQGGDLPDCRPIFLSRCGAHLHGTATDESDLDVVGVFIEPLSKLVTGQDNQRHTFTTGSKDRRNNQDDLDLTLVELRTAVEKMVENEPKWVEVLHANDENILLTTDCFEDLRSHSLRLHSNQIEPFISYARSQANKYEQRSERLEYVKKFLSVIEDYEDETPLSAFVDELPRDHESIRQVKRDDKPDRLHAFNRKFDWEAPVRLLREALLSIKDDYGRRVRSAKSEDFKSLAHAYRLGYEAREYRTTGGLSFPLEQAEELRRIKTGKIDFEEARSGVQEVIDRAVQADSALPETPDRDWAQQWLVSQYSKYANDL